MRRPRAVVRYVGHADPPAQDPRRRRPPCVTPALKVGHRPPPRRTSRCGPRIYVDHRSAPRRPPVSTRFSFDHPAAAVPCCCATPSYRHPPDADDDRVAGRDCPRAAHGRTGRRRAGVAGRAIVAFTERKAVAGVGRAYQARCRYLRLVGSLPGEVWMRAVAGHRQAGRLRHQRAVPAGRPGQGGHRGAVRRRSEYESMANLLTGTTSPMRIVAGGRAPRLCQPARRWRPSASPAASRCPPIDELGRPGAAAAAGRNFVLRTSECGPHRIPRQGLEPHRRTRWHGGCCHRETGDADSDDDKPPGCRCRATRRDPQGRPRRFRCRHCPARSSRRSRWSAVAGPIVNGRGGSQLRRHSARSSSRRGTLIAAALPRGRHRRGRHRRGGAGGQSGGFGDDRLAGVSHMA